jgi:hypothetical protein
MFKDDIKKIISAHTKLTLEIEEKKKEQKVLTEQGVNWGKAHYKREKYLRIIQPMQKDGTRPEEYIGNKADKVKKALQEIENARLYKDLDNEIEYLNYRLNEISSDIRKTAKIY